MLRMKPKICDKIVAICGLKRQSWPNADKKSSKVLLGSKSFR